MSESSSNFLQKICQGERRIKLIKIFFRNLESFGKPFRFKFVTIIARQCYIIEIVRI
jgi:hypothetical protein